MKECLIIGMALGFIAGAVLVQGNREAEQLVKKGKNAVMKKFSDIKESLQNSNDNN